jgi:hypothetical protein
VASFKFDYIKKFIVAAFAQFGSDMDANPLQVQQQAIFAILR